MKFYLLIVFHIVGYISGLKTLKVVPSFEFIQSRIHFESRIVMNRKSILNQIGPPRIGIGSIISNTVENEAYLSVKVHSWKQ